MSKNFRKFFKSKYPYRMSEFDDYVKQWENTMTPYVTKESQERMVQVDVFSALMEKSRIITFNEDVNSNTASIALSQLLYLHSVDSDSPISLYICSPGGDVYSGLALYDTMQLVKQDLDLSTVCCGLAASMGSILLSGGTKGKRFALPNSTVMIHSVSTGSGRITYPDLKIMTRETEALNEKLMKILSDNSGKPYNEVVEDCGRDRWLRAEECLPGNYGELGLVDKIITKL